MPTLHQFARQLRLQQTDCERLIWQKLRARQVLDLKFRRNIPARLMYWIFTALNCNWLLSWMAVSISRLSSAAMTSGGVSI